MVLDELAFDGERLPPAEALQRALEELERTRKRLRDYEECVEGLEEMIVVVDRDYRYLLANRAFLDYWGLAGEDLLGQAAPELHRDVWHQVAKRLDESFTGKVVKYELRYEHPQKGERYLDVQYFPIDGPKGVERVAAVLHDVTERKRVEAERTQILRRLISAQEDERRRIAREMHDQFGQQLSALNLQISRLRNEYTTAPRLREQLVTLEAIANRLDRDVDFFVWEMRPTALDDLGLVVALGNYAEDWARHVGIRVDFHSSGMDWVRLPGEIETALYRVTQEALTNIAKHANARSATILVERRSDHISLIVEDDGVGFDVERTLSAQPNGLGLAGMRERVGLVEGTVQIESRAAGGVTVAVRIPIVPA